MNKFLLSMIFLVWMTMFRPYSTIDAQKSKVPFTKSDSNISSTNNKSDSNIKTEDMPLILKKKEEIKKSKFDSSFLLQNKIIETLKKATKPDPKVKYIPIYKVIPIYIPLQDSLKYTEKLNKIDTLTNDSYMEQLSDFNFGCLGVTDKTEPIKKKRTLLQKIFGTNKRK